MCLEISSINKLLQVGRAHFKPKCESTEKKGKENSKSTNICYVEQILNKKMFEKRGKMVRQGSQIK